MADRGVMAESVIESVIESVMRGSVKCEKNGINSRAL